MVKKYDFTNLYSENTQPYLKDEVNFDQARFL